MQEQKEKLREEIRKILEGWQKKRAPEALIKEQQKIEHLMQELKAIAVQEMQWHEKWKQEEQTQIAQLYAA